MGHNRVFVNVDKFVDYPTINSLFSRLFRRFIKLKVVQTKKYLVHPSNNGIDRGLCFCFSAGDN